MGQEKETKTREEPKVEIQERGEIFFFYRPKANQEEPRSANDVQNMYIVLRPDSGEKKPCCDCEPGKEDDAIANEPSTEDHDDHKKNTNESEDPSEGHGSEFGKESKVERQPLLRFIVLGRKSLPEASKRSRPYWGFVELVTTNREDLQGALSAGEPGAATRGSRAKPAARALAQGMYRILRHYPSEKGMHTHLVYKLEDQEKQEPQEALNVKGEGSFIIQIKNPEKATPPSSGLQNKRKASFPARLQGLFGSSRFVSADPPDFLNYEGCEFILISAADDVDAELGLDIKDGVSCSPDLVVKKMFEEMVPVEPLLLHGTRA